MSEERPSPLDIFYPDVAHSMPLWSVETGTWSRAWVETVLSALPMHGGLVIDPFARHPVLVTATLASERSLVAANLDPTALLALRLLVTPPEPRRLDVAFSRLADSRYGGLSFAQYAEQFYRTTCPSCHASIAADFFVWDGEGAGLVEKAYACRWCGAKGTASATPSDREVVADIEAKGPRYWQLVGRLVPPGDELTPRVEELVGIYTPRNRQVALALALQIENVVSDSEEQRWLRGLLLSCLERGHSARSTAMLDRPTRPTRLRWPRRFIERNMWQLFEQGYRLLRQRSAMATGEVWTQRLPPDRGRVLLQPMTARAIAQALPPSSVDLILTEAPRADPVAYGLAFLWTGWLYGRAAAAPLRSLVSRRNLDWNWYGQALGAALRTLVPALRPQGWVVLACATWYDEQLPAMLLAAERAGLRLTAATAVTTSDGVAHRLVFEQAARGAARQATAAHLSDWSHIGQTAVMQALRARGQPTSTDILARAIWWAWARRAPAVAAAQAQDTPVTRKQAVLALLEQMRQQGNIVPVSPAGESETPPEFRQADAAWWLADASTALPPLADRVERAMLTHLRQQAQWTEAELMQVLYQAFPSIESPEPTLMAAILRSYAAEEEGIWRLRPEDEAPARIAEVSTLIDALLLLGRTLGYEAMPIADRSSSWWPCHVCWLENGQVRYGFVLQETAEVGPWLRRPPSPLVDASRYILVPASRSGLLVYKLKHVAGWSAWLAAAGWQFTKNRHWRHLALMPHLDRAGFAARLPLDPIIEASEAQLPLFP